MKQLEVVMVGPDISVQGGISTIIDEYLKAGLSDRVDLEFVPTLQEGSKLHKSMVFVRAIGPVVAALRRMDQPVMHLHLSQNGSFVRKLVLFTLARSFRAKTVVHLHGSRFEAFMHRNRLTTLLTRHMFDNATRVLVGSDLWQEKLKAFSRNRNITTFYNPIQLGPSRDSSDETIDVLFLGRLGERKGTYDILKTIEDRADFFREHRVRFILAGDGDVDEVRATVDKRGWGDFVVVPGWTAGEDKMALLRSSDILTLPSYNEQMPMSVLEGMSHGYPIVASDIAGIPEMVEDGRNGFLFKPGDVASMTDAFVRLVGDPDLRHRMGRESRAIVEEKFEGSVVLDTLVGIYADALGSSVPPATTES